MMETRSSKWWISLSFAVLLGLVYCCEAEATSRDLMILNQSGKKVAIYWVHPYTRELSLMSNPHVIPGAEFPLNSFVGHEFEMHELPSSKTGTCGPNNVCQKGLFAVSENAEQQVTIDPNFVIQFVDNRVKAQEAANMLLESCRAAAKASVDEDPSQDNLVRSMEELVRCVETGVAGSIQKSNEEIAFQASVRKDIAAKLENYTCTDSTLGTSPSLSSNVWYDGSASQAHVPRQVNVMHNRPASKIHVIENFIDAEECQAMEDAAVPLLHRATVADGKGGSQLSANRKAMQAGITVPWHLEAEGNPIARLSRRVYDYTNHVLGLNLEHHGQEDLMSIQYFGRGRDDTEPDRYTPHCDGDCTGLPFKHGTRMATMVMYCNVPEEGGHTNFRNSGVHFKPTAGSAVFFAYIDPKELIMDTGFTEHSGCPVYRGEKKIVTQWIRYGVTAESPWDSYNTLGVKRSEEDGV